MTTIQVKAMAYEVSKLAKLTDKLNAHLKFLSEQGFEIEISSCMDTSNDLASVSINTVKYNGWRKP